MLVASNFAFRACLISFHLFHPPIISDLPGAVKLLCVFIIPNKRCSRDGTLFSLFIIIIYFEKVFLQTELELDSCPI